jgi:hypothetical protein
MEREGMIDSKMWDMYSKYEYPKAYEKSLLIRMPEKVLSKMENSKA